MRNILTILALSAASVSATTALAHDTLGNAAVTWGNGGPPLDLVNTERQYRQVVAFGRCVVASDRAGSVAYVRAAAIGTDVREYPALRGTQQHCYRTVARNAWQLGTTAVRVSAVANALRMN